jgi:hypothetical protein
MNGRASACEKSSVDIFGTLAIPRGPIMDRAILLASPISG